MNLTRLAITNNRLTWAALLIIFVAGLQAFKTMPRAYDPGFIIRAAQVVTYFPGASPERVEKLVTSQIEDVAKQIPELDYVTSESRTGVSVVTVSIKESYKDMRPIWDNLRRKVESASTDLPAGVVGPFVNDEFGDVYGIVMTITGEGFDYDYLHDIADGVQQELLRVPEAAKVDILGEQERRVFVEYNNARLAELGISPSQLSQLLAARNIIISGGAINLDTERVALEPSGNFESLEDIAQTLIAVPGTDQLIVLRDIADVYEDYIDPPESLIHSSGKPAVALAISMREGGNNIVLGEQVKAALHTLEEIYPWGVEFQLVNFSPAEVDKKVSNFVVNLLQSITVVTLVMLLSLGLRTGLIVATLIPTTMLMAIIVMNQLQIGFDQVSLAALIIALGMLVDNGIVMSENILVQMEKGKPALAAAVDSATELRVPLLTASLTTAAAFLPIYLAESNVGEFTASLFKVVTITLLCSWLVALTFIPMLCVYFLKVPPQSNTGTNRFYQAYEKFLRWSITWRYWVIAAVVVLFCVSMLGFKFVPKLFFPPSDRAYFKVELELPMGTSIETSEAVVEGLERFLASELPQAKSASDTAGVINWISYVGNAGPRFILSHNPKPSSSEYALILVNVSDFSAIADYMQKIKTFALRQYPDADVTTRLIETGPSVENPVEIRIAGKNSDLLFKLVDELKLKMTDIGGLTNISDNWGQKIKKLEVKVNQARALRAGVSSQDIAVSLQAGLTGIELTEYREDEDVIPVILRSNAAKEDSINKVESLSVYSQQLGKSLPLKQVADVQLVWDVAKVYRRDGLRNVAVGAQVEDGITAAEKFHELDPWVTEQQQKYQGQLLLEYGGERESSGKANQSIIEKLGIAGFVILLLLVGQFNSIRKAGIVLCTIPLGLIGVIIGLLVFRTFFGFMTFLGIISLAGIVINNAIVLLERIQLELDAGVKQMEAVISAALQRFRPIMLTTMTTVLGLLPLYISGGEMWEPMAVSIMVGLGFSTLLTLIVVPVLYTIFYQVTPNSNEVTA